MKQLTNFLMDGDCSFVFCKKKMYFYKPNGQSVKQQRVLLFRAPMDWMLKSVAAGYSHHTKRVPLLQVIRPTRMKYVFIIIIYLQASIIKMIALFVRNSTFSSHLHCLWFVFFIFLFTSLTSIMISCHKSSAIHIRFHFTKYPSCGVNSAKLFVLNIWHARC